MILPKLLEKYKKNEQCVDTIIGSYNFDEIIDIAKDEKILTQNYIKDVIEYAKATRKEQIANNDASVDNLAVLIFQSILEDTEYYKGLAKYCNKSKQKEHDDYVQDISTKIHECFMKAWENGVRDIHELCNASFIKIENKYGYTESHGYSIAEARKIKLALIENKQLP